MTDRPLSRDLSESPEHTDALVGIGPLTRALERAGFESFATGLPARIRSAFSKAAHGDLPKWLSVIENLPELPAHSIGLDEALVRVDSEEPLDAESISELRTTLLRLHPWRKGPYSIHGVTIDSEWRSDWKWDRLKHAISPLLKRRVLDVGCGNGYHCWRMAGAGAELVVGVDPTLLSVLQFLAVRHFIGSPKVFVIPLAVEALPASVSGFDTVFSMGVLYHRKSPLDHLSELAGFLRPGGELVLETLVADGPEGYALLPQDRYAMMRNVFFIPSCPTLIAWLRRCGFRNIRLIDVTATTVGEQRSTEWMRFHSLAEFLDPQDPSLTREGLPAPKRAIVIANRA